MSISLGQVSLMSKRKALFLLEGDKTERQFLNRVTKYYPDILVDYYVIGTNIFDLNNHLCNVIGEDWLSDGQKIVNLLINMKPLSGTGSTTNRMLDVDSFTDIFLIFDFEKLGTSFSVDLLLRMQRFFSDSTRNGLLLLNYPMVEAYRHLKCVPDSEYVTRTYSIASGEHYKTIVGRESKYTNLHKYDKEMIDYIFYINKLKLDKYTYSAMSLSEKLYLFLQYQSHQTDILVEFTMILFLELYNISGYSGNLINAAIHRTSNQAETTDLFA